MEIMSNFFVLQSRYITRVRRTVRPSVLCIDFRKHTRDTGVVVNTLHIRTSPTYVYITRYKRNSCQVILGMLLGAINIFPLFRVVVQGRIWKIHQLGEQRGFLKLPSPFSVNLFGIPEIPVALQCAISSGRLHNIVFISSCNPSQTRSLL